MIFHSFHAPEFKTTPAASPLSFGVWLATEGGRKCPRCGRYAKTVELGYIGGRFRVGKTVGILTMYGHLPGFGCNGEDSP